MFRTYQNFDRSRFSLFTTTAHKLGPLQCNSKLTGDNHDAIAGPAPGPQTPTRESGPWQRARPAAAPLRETLLYLRMKGQHWKGDRDIAGTVRVRSVTVTQSAAAAAESDPA